MGVYKKMHQIDRADSADEHLYLFQLDYGYYDDALTPKNDVYIYRKAVTQLTPDLGPNSRNVDRRAGACGRVRLAAAHAYRLHARSCPWRSWPRLHTRPLELIHRT